MVSNIFQLPLREVSVDRSIKVAFTLDEESQSPAWVAWVRQDDGLASEAWSHVGAFSTRERAEMAAKAFLDLQFIIGAKLSLDQKA